MFLENELSDKLNIELEAAGISVSETLVARTLEAVKQARAAEKQTALEQEIQSDVQNLSEVREKKHMSLRSTLFRAAGVIAACFVLVVGGFALRFGTMRTGKDSAAPMAVTMESARTNSRSTASGSNDMAMEECDSGIVPEAAVADAENGFDYEYAGLADEAYQEEQNVLLAEDTVTSEDNEECKTDVVAEGLFELLANADSVEKALSAQGTTVYRFMVTDIQGKRFCYQVQEDGTVAYAEVTQNGETGAFMLYEKADSKELKRSVLVWMKQNGY